MALPIGPVELEGERSSKQVDGNFVDGIFATDGWADDNFNIKWDIASVNDHYEYKYTLSVSGVKQVKGLSHWIFQISDDATVNDFWGFAAWTNSEDDEDIFNEVDIIEALDNHEPSGSDPPNPYMPDDIWGFKIETITGEDFGPQTTFMFNSIRVPIWGNMYAKNGMHDGIWATACNIGLEDPNSTDPIDYIVVPDTNVIPEPGTVILMLFGLLGLVGVKKKIH